MNVFDFRKWCSQGTIPVLESKSDLASADWETTLAWVRSEDALFERPRGSDTWRRVADDKIRKALAYLVGHTARRPVAVPKRQACIVFTSDDGHRADYEKLGPLAKDLKVPFVLGIVSNYVDNNPVSMSSEEIQQMVDWGCEIAAHSVSHPRLALLGRSDKVMEIKGSFLWLRQKGWKVRNFIYPYGGQDVFSEKIVRLSGGAGCLIKGGIATPPFLSSRIPRWAMGSYFRDGVNTYEDYLKMVNHAADAGRMLVWMLHPGNEQHDSRQQEALVRIIKYCRNKEICITTLSEALSHHGNLWESSVDYGGEMLIDCDGVIWFSNVPALLRPLQRLCDSRIFAMVVYGMSWTVSKLRAARKPGSIFNRALKPILK